MISISTKMSDVIFEDVFALSILDRLDIKIGFGDKTVEQVCNENNVNSRLFIHIVRLFLYGTIPSDINANKELIPSLITYFKITHEYYLKKIIPLTESLISELENKEKERNKDIKLLKKFFEQYKHELITHIDNEEKNVFPYVLKIYNAYKTQNVDEKLLDEVKHHSISAFEKEHDNLDEKLNDLKSIIIKYFQPFKNSYIINQILVTVFQLEKDVFEHAQLEDLMMIPVVRGIEKEINSQKLNI